MTCSEYRNWLGILMYPMPLRQRPNVSQTLCINPWKALEGKKQALEDAGKKLEYLTTTYDILINSDETVIVGRFHKNSVYREEAKYLEYVKNNFGEEIADAIEDVPASISEEVLTVNLQILKSTLKSSNYLTLKKSR